MAHFAKINKQNIVEQVIVADSQEWCESNLGGEWVQTSYNTQGGVHINGGEPLRKNYAGVGYTYDRNRDAFIPPQPYPSWILDANLVWQPPVPAPVVEGKFFEWSEEKLSWEESTI